MFELPIKYDAFYLMLYGSVTALSLIACCYLLFRRANAIAPDVTSPVRLRRWTAAFFASITLSHIWYTPVLYLTFLGDIVRVYCTAAMLDILIVYPLAFGLLLAMLQDRRRPLWPVFVLITPTIVVEAWFAFTLNYDLIAVFYVFYLLLMLLLFIYMARAVRQYGRWLRDNFADLEHKEVWQSFVAMAIMLLTFSIYALEIKGMLFKFITQVNDVVLICFLLWRVETLSDLGGSQAEALPEAEPEASAGNEAGADPLPQSIRDKLGPLLQHHCVGTQLYLQHDLTLQQLAKAIGTNRFYLSQYFSQQGMTYNAYINNLRIDRFIELFRQAAAEKRNVTAQWLASESGFRSYSTFSAAFKQRMGQTVMAWMRSTADAMASSA